MQLIAKEKNSKGFANRCLRAQQCVIFEELFVILFKVFDHFWQLENKDKDYQEAYFTFSKVLKDMEKHTIDILAQKPSDYKVFEYLLLEYNI